MLGVPKRGKVNSVADVPERDKFNSVGSIPTNQIYYLILSLKGTN